MGCFLGSENGKGLFFKWLFIILGFELGLCQFRVLGNSWVVFFGLFLGAFAAEGELVAEVIWG